MSDSRFLKDLIDYRFFELPHKKLKCRWLSFKFHMHSISITAEKPELYVCNKTSPYDIDFISQTMNGNYVFLKNEVVEKIYNKTLSQEEKTEFLENVEKLRMASVSIVMFPENHLSIFGDFAKISRVMTDVIFEMSYEKIKYINLIGTFFIKPIWSETSNVCETKLEQKFNFYCGDFTSNELDEFCFEFNKHIPSSASTYSHKIPIYSKNKRLAEHLETVLYLCPNCGKLFTLYSEFNLVKCRDCGSAFEINYNYEIDLTKQFSNLDEANQFQFEILKSINFSDSRIISYVNAFFGIDKNVNEPTYLPTTLDVYTNKIEFYIPQNNEKIFLELLYDNIIDAYLSHQNKLFITYKSNQKNAETISFQGKNCENFNIILDLIKIYKNKSK